MSTPIPAPAYKVRKRNLNAGSIETISVGLALSSLYDPHTGVAVAPRSRLARMTHYSEKRTRTAVRRLIEAGVWQRVPSERPNAPATYAPVI